jgi:hypothetical protein
MFIQKIKEQLIKDDEPQVKDSFWATDAEKDGFELYHRWIGTPPTNPLKPEKYVMFNAGRMMELALINKLGDIVIAKQERVEFETHSIKVSGYIDAKTKDAILEIKTYYGYHQEKELIEGKPKTSYLKQLAIYMYPTDLDRGYLLYFERGNGNMYEFILERKTDVLFRCGDIEFNLDDVFRKWSFLYYNHIIPRREPQPEFKYKYPIESVNWKALPKSELEKVLTGQKVIGDWQVLYSPYKDLYIQHEKTTLGYTLDEINTIKKLLNQ